MELIDSFLEENKKANNSEKFCHKDDLILKGIIKMHAETCLREDCPLIKFLKNKGNYNTQKQCLLNYMASLFIDAIKKFPQNILIRMYFIQFNYDKKYNLNSIKTTLEEIKKIKYNLSSEFILYCQEKEISKIKSKDVNDGDDEEKEKLILDQNYKKLRSLISNSTKLYVEFWGIFAANITNNLNTQKLYKLGEKLNAYLKEINYLWENNLKDKKIDTDNEINAQLFCKFLREILWAQNKSDEVQNKINEEHNLQPYNRIISEENIQLENLDNLESQELMVYANSNENGKTNIIHLTKSITYLTGYQKEDLLNKPFNILLPPVLAEINPKAVEACIKIFCIEKNQNKESLQVANNQKTISLVKSKIGYIIPFNFRCIFYDNNDFSNNFLIKTFYESRDPKSMYAYYLLTRADFSLDNISSSSINLGLSLDLLKKYVIKLNVLIRTDNDENLILLEKHNEYKGEAGIVTWVYPELIYPKDDNSKLKDIPLQDLIKQSKKSKLFMEVIEVKNFYNGEVSGYIFKLFEKRRFNSQKEEELKRFIPDIKNQFLFDLLSMNYIRTKIVKEKSGFRNLRESVDDVENQNNVKDAIGSRKRKDYNKEASLLGIISEEENEEVIITKEKLFELQTKDSIGIKAFINLLPFYGNEVSLVRHRANRELYSSGKAQEPQIKIDISKYIQLVESKLKENPKLFKKIKSLQKERKINNNIENSPIKKNYISDNIKEDENKNVGAVIVNKDFSGNANVSLINIINISSIQAVKIVDFFIYFFVVAIITIQFILSHDFYNKNDKRHSYFNYSYQLLNDITYIKYYVSEGIYINDVPDYKTMSYIDKSAYLERIKLRLLEYGEDLAHIIYQFNNPNVALPDEYIEYIANTNLTIKTNNMISKTEQQPYSSALNKLTTSIFYISSSDKDDFNMDNNYAYELMVNLLDSYFVTFEKIIYIMSNYLDKTTGNISIINFTIFFVSLVISIIYLIIFYRMMVNLEKDREKPLNLFLTIKNKIFEDLKNSSENFSNKLLNKFFLADENEEESQQNYNLINIKPTDINIAKFKALNEYKSLNKKENSFWKYFLQLILFYGLFIVVIFLEYINTNFFCNKIHNYIQIYNSTYISETFLVTKINIIKQYFYNSSITNYGYLEEDIIKNFLDSFLLMSKEIEPTIKESSKTNSFLEDVYKDLFTKYYYSNFTELINKDVNDSDIYSELSEYIDYGYSYANLRIFEMLRYLCIKYFMNSQRILGKGISALINHNYWLEINKLLNGIVRHWYKNMNDLITSYYSEYVSKSVNSNIFIFIILLIIISLYYWIVWKHCEEQLIDSIQKSFDLINLIPEEIKNIIINKLNEN